MALGLWNGLALQVEWKGFDGTAEDSKKVVLPDLDCAFRQVSTVIVRREKLIGHLCVLYFSVVGGGYFVVKDLVSWDEALEFHACKGALPGEDHFAFCPVLYWLNP